MAETLTGLKRTHYCGEPRPSDIGKEVTVFGWAQRCRDLGSLIFIDLRDRTGLLQLAVRQDVDAAAFDKAFTVRAEYVLAARGVVRRRETPNPKLETGEVEVEVHELRILAKSETPPFEITDDTGVREELRLQYRYLDLRRPVMQRNLQMRHRIVKAAHDYFDRNGFLEIETPALIKSTPEGARDYLVPSRVHPGSFYALPQSPQLYKQLLMLAGYDRYMQVARCFRDEDLRADRQPEFTQLDMEMSFVDEDDIMAINEGFVREVFQKVLGVEVKTPFRRMTWRRAMALYGSDKPDLRFGLTMTDLSDAVKGCGFRVFAGALSGGGAVCGLNVKGGYGALPRKELDRLTTTAKDNGAKGLAWTRLGPDTASSSYEKFLTETERDAVRSALGAQPGDVLLIVADTDPVAAHTALGAVRLEVGRRMNLIDDKKFEFLWVTEFPLFEYSKEEGRFVAMHHPFTAPMEEDVSLLQSDKAHCRARAYDMVLNGIELGGGSIRINDPGTQRRMFEALGFTDEEAQKRFGFLIDAFRYGAPPHGGMAYGLDRLCMLMLRCPSIRDVIAFPKVQSARELMTGCPTPVDAAQLRELSLEAAEKKSPEEPAGFKES